MISKTELVWRHLLAAALEGGQRRHASMSAVARELELPSSTVHDALRRPVEVEAVITSGRALRVVNPWKLLMLWAARRSHAGEVVAVWQTDLPALEVEERLWSEHRIISGFGGVVSHRDRNGIAEYSQVLAYGVPLDLPSGGGPTTVTFLAPDPYLERYGKVAPLGQCFVDLFVTPGTSAARFIDVLSRELPDADRG